jgi:sialate O-acetylesterase
VLAILCTIAMQKPMLKLPPVFGDNMVLQRHADISFYGQAAPTKKVTIRLNGKFVETTAKADGTWRANFRPMEAGGPYTVSVTSDTSLEYKNVMVGEVWIASGQSNMEWIQANASDFEQATKEADPDVRMFTAQKVSAEVPQTDVPGVWQVASEDTVAGFSAVANAFAHELHRRLDVPIGIIHTSWGGTPVESWTSRPALEAEEASREMVPKYLAGLRDFDERKATFDKAFAEWNAKVLAVDPGNKGSAMGYAGFDKYTRDWHTVQLPNRIEATEGADMNGAVWYRKDLVLPDDWFGKPLTLRLGPIDDMDDTYVNGHKVGFTNESTPYYWAVKRKYRVAPGVLRRGRNVVAVRVFDAGGQGGFVGTPLQMTLGPEDGSGTAMSLAGDWISKVELRVDPPTEEQLAERPETPFGPGHPWAPGGLFNGMIAPFVPYTIRGAIWYQGESNADRAEQYGSIFPNMIRDWRARWGLGDFPFYFVQLANFNARNEEPVESDWAELREAQAKTLSLPNTGMAVTIDIGEANDIHPKNKREVGRRLALNALAGTYNISTPHTGPQLSKATFVDHACHLTFTGAKELRTRDGSAVRGFAISGTDRKFYWAEALVKGREITLTSSKVSNPTAARYGWSSNPDVNLTDETGLPASPFRTDDWPAITAGKR